MLDGLLGRGFAAKCKSLIKATKARIELIQRKRSARERFLKKDIADLLATGLDHNAFGRTEGLMTELTLSSCYNYVEECCDLLYKKLSEMQKQSDCPADCKEAVASLMFSAARVSDLPELRELREAFQEKYGNSLQYCVNQKFVAEFSSPAPTTEKKIQLMQDIAAEYSISWNCRSFEKQMSKPPDYVKTSQHGSVALPLKDILKGDAEGGNSTYPKDHILSKVNYKYSSNQNGSRPRNGNGMAENINMQSLQRPVDEAKGKPDNEPKLVKAKESNQLNGIDTSGQTSQLGRSSNGRDHDHIHKARGMKDSGAIPSPKREMQQTVFHMQQVIHTPIERLEVHIGNHKDNSANLPNARKLHDADKLINARSMMPPPYVKPPKVVKSEMVSDLQHTGYNGNDASGSSKAASSRTSTSFNTADGIQSVFCNEKETSCTSKGMGNGYADVHINYNDPASDQSVLEPKSVRRHSSKPASAQDDATRTHENGKTEKRSSSSRKRSERKQGMQILFDDEQPVKDDERALDKLLIHLSRKPTNFDPEKLRRMSDLQPPRQMPSDNRRPHVDSKLKPGNVTPLAPHTTRSVSLPHESVLPEPAKVFARAASFQPDRPAKHVHPNLPDCDDLAARIAALRGSY